MADRSTASEETIGTLIAGTPALNDLIHFYRSNSDFKATMQQFAKFVLEDYAGSTLAGGARSAKSAIDLLNSRSDYKTILGQTNDVFLSSPGSYWASRAQNLPINDYGYLDHIMPGADSQERRLEFVQYSTGDKYVAISTNGGSSWSNWKKQPTRQEIDSLNSRMGDSTAAGFHNSIYRGKNITSYLTDATLWKRITGTSGYTLFEDLYLGDYITVGSNSYAIVDFDYYLRCGDRDFTQHHIVMMPTANMNIPAGTVLYGSSGTLTFINTANAGTTVSSQETATAFKWNATMAAPNTNTTAGGYKYSRMRTVIMKAANTIVINAFGSSHVKPIPVLYYSPAAATDSGLASGWAWFNSDDQTNILAKSICDLPNETQIYGQQVWGLGADGNNVGYEIGVDKFQFAIFALQKNFANIRADSWLRSVNSASSAARVLNTGNALYTGSAYAYGVRPRFLLVG